MKRIAIFASGSGSNAENIFHYFQGNQEIHVALIVCNKPGAGIISRADRLGIPVLLINREDWMHPMRVVEWLKMNEISYIVLAGFLWLVPKDLITAFPDKIINIHPALLPKYGGKGMYGEKVHEAVYKNAEKESGITIHLVNEKYDDGMHLFKHSFPISEQDTPESIAEKVHELEYRYFPSVIEKYILQK
jgi:phosphoribosylglycinamide formyltransferase-1